MAQAPKTGPAEFKLPKPTESEDWHEDAKILVEAIQQHQNAQLAQRDEQLSKQQELLTRLIKEREEQDRQQYVTRFDKFIDTLGADWEPVFGRGSGFSLPRNGIAVQNRVHLDLMAAQLSRSLQAMGQPNLEAEELLSRALNVAFSEQAKQQVRRTVTSELTGRQRQMTARPNQRKGRQLSGTEKAIQTANAFYKTLGQDDDAFNDEV